MRILYVIGEFSPTSIPLEVAQNIKDNDIQLHVAGFYSSTYELEGGSFKTIRVGARGWSDINAIRKIYKYIRAYKPDVVHVHHTVSAFWASLFGKTNGAKLVRTEHNNTNFRTVVQKLPNSVGRTLADFLICNSKNTYQSLSTFQKRLVGDQCSVIYNGIDVDRIDRASNMRPPFERKEEAVTVGSVGRLTEQKNYSRFLEAFDQVRNVFEQEIRLIIIGDGEEQENLERKASRLGLGDQVCFTGRINRDDVYAALHTFDIFVMPSLWEGFCNAAVEAMAARLPLVCSDIPTLKEVVGGVAMYSNPDDSSHFASTLLSLVKKGGEEWDRKGEEARKRAVKRYSVSSTAERYVQVYRKVIAS
jgi:glycosyltransferase involved in cell wall biosynthesis